MSRRNLLSEFANSPSEVHAIAAGASFGGLTAFLWVTYSRTVAIAFGIIYLSVVTGVRFHRLLKTVDGDLIDNQTRLLRQLRKEGHYSVTAFTIGAAVVYVVLKIG